MKKIPESIVEKNDQVNPSHDLSLPVEDLSSHSQEIAQPVIVTRVHKQKKSPLARDLDKLPTPSFAFEKTRKAPEAFIPVEDSIQSPFGSFVVEPIAPMAFVTREEGAEVIKVKPVNKHRIHRRHSRKRTFII